MVGCHGRLPGHRLAVDKTCNGATHNLKAQIGAFHAASKKEIFKWPKYNCIHRKGGVCVWVCHLQFKDHVEHALGTVGLQQLDNVRMLQHVTYCGFAFQI